MVLLTVDEYPYEIEKDIEKMKEEGFSTDEIIGCMEDLQRALEDKINELDNKW